MPPESNEINAAALALLRAKSIVTVSHRRPDADTIGSALALAAALTAAGKPVRCFCADRPPSSLEFLPAIGSFTSDPGAFIGADLVAVLDSGDLRFTAAEPCIAAMPSRPLILNVDHHAVNERFGDVNAVIPSAASATEVVLRIIKAMSLAVTPDIATCLLVGIVADTMMFFNPATTASSLQVAAELERLGGDMKAVSRLISKNRSVGSLVLWGKALERLKWDEQRSHVSTAVMEHELAAQPGDDPTDGLSNFLNNNLSARTVLVLKELGNGMVKGSLRTANEDVDVSEMAARYGGGGHRKAAGFAIKGKIVEKDKEWTVEV